MSYTCTFCNKLFDTQKALSIHVKKTKKDHETVDGVTCEHCERKFVSQKTLNVHYKTCPKHSTRILESIDSKIELERKRIQDEYDSRIQEISKEKEELKVVYEKKIEKLSHEHSISTVKMRGEISSLEAQIDLLKKHDVAINNYANATIKAYKQSVAPTTNIHVTNNIQNNIKTIVSSFKSMDQEFINREMQNIGANLLRGIDGIAEYMSQTAIKDNLLLTDESRKSWTYVDDKNNIVKDVKGKRIGTMVMSSVRDASADYYHNTNPDIHKRKHIQQLKDISEGKIEQYATELMKNYSKSALKKIDFLDGKKENNSPKFAKLSYSIRKNLGKCPFMHYGEYGIQGFLSWFFSKNQIKIVRAYGKLIIILQDDNNVEYRDEDCKIFLDLFITQAQKFSASFVDKLEEKLLKCSEDDKELITSCLQECISLEDGVLTDELKLKFFSFIDCLDIQGDNDD